MADPICAFCGRVQGAHRIVKDGYTQRLMLDGHLFVALHFPGWGPPTIQPAALKYQLGGDDMWTVLKAEKLDAFPLEELIAGLRFGKDVIDEHQQNGVPAPTWLTARVSKLQAMVRRLKIEVIEGELAAAQKEERGLRTADEKRVEVKNRILMLEDALAQASTGNSPATATDAAKETT